MAPRRFSSCRPGMLARACTAAGTKPVQPAQLRVLRSPSPAQQCITKELKHHNVCVKMGPSQYKSNGVDHVAAQGLHQVCQPCEISQRLAEEDSLWYLLVPSRCCPPCQLWCSIPDVWYQRTGTTHTSQNSISIRVCMGASQYTGNGVNHVKDCLSRT